MYPFVNMSYANSVEPDQTSCPVASDLPLHCCVKLINGIISINGLISEY